MLAFDPEARITVPKALEHPWLASYHDISDEPDCPQVFDRWQEIERLDTLDDFRDALWNEIEDYRREVRGLKFTSLKRTLSTPAVKGLEATSMLGKEPEQERSVFEPDIENCTEPETTSTAVEEQVEGAELALADAERTAASPRKLADSNPAAFCPTDPVVMYARRSSILQPSRQNSTYNSPVPPAQNLPSFIGDAQTIQSEPSGLIFPAQGYIVPARSRTASTVGGDITRKLLHTLSTVSIHESGENFAGGLAGIAPMGKFIMAGRTEADAPPSEMPRDFDIKSSSDGTEEEKKREGGQSKIFTLG